MSKLLEHRKGLNQLAELDGDLCGVEVGRELKVALGRLNFGNFKVDFETGNVEDGLCCSVRLFATQSVHVSSGDQVVRGEGEVLQ